MLDTSIFINISFFSSTVLEKGVSVCLLTITGQVQSTGHRLVHAQYCQGPEVDEGVMK